MSAYIFLQIAPRKTISSRTEKLRFLYTKEKENCRAHLCTCFPCTNKQYHITFNRSKTIYNIDKLHTLIRVYLTTLHCIIFSAKPFVNITGIINKLIKNIAY